MTQFSTLPLQLKDKCIGKPQEESDGIRKRKKEMKAGA